MCPFCIGAVAWVTAGAATTAGLGALFAAVLPRTHESAGEHRRVESDATPDAARPISDRGSG